MNQGQGAGHRATEKHLILVAGSGRSGTSLFSGLLKALGCHVPQPEVVPDDTNPRGFSEPQWVVDYHVKLLHAAGVHSSDARPGAWAATAEAAGDPAAVRQLQAWLGPQLRRSDNVVIKDPRLLWFTHAWSSTGAQLGAVSRFATLLRHPLEVVKSKQTYYGQALHPNNRTAGWINTMLLTERVTRNQPRVFVEYDDLLSDWRQVVARVNSQLGLELDEHDTPQTRAVERFIDPTLRRSTATWEALEVNPALADLAEQTWSLLRRAAATEGNVASDGEFDQQREAYDALYTTAETVAQSTILAVRRERERPPSRLRRILGRGKRLVKRTLHRLRPR